jgi:uncharacterized protein YcbK (DUF882 family)
VFVWRRALITRDEILKGNVCPAEYEENLTKLLEALNIVRSNYGKPLVIVSGYRTPEYNKKVGGYSNSAHLTCQAADIRDYSRDLTNWLLSNINLLVNTGLYMESPKFAVSWVHLQIRPTKSRIFNP